MALCLVLVVLVSWQVSSVAFMPSLVLSVVMAVMLLASLVLVWVALAVMLPWTAR